MSEERAKPRLDEGNYVEITVISAKKNISKEKVMYNYIKDFSSSGVNIQTNVLLPVGALLNVNFTLKTLRQKIIAIGRIKWVKTISEDKYYEMGVEFVNGPVYALQKLDEYILWKEKNKKPKSALGILVNKHITKE
jgi:hypothetical protein